MKVYAVSQKNLVMSKYMIEFANQNVILFRGKYRKCIKIKPRTSCVPKKHIDFQDISKFKILREILKNSVGILSDWPDFIELRNIDHIRNISMIFDKIIL